MGVQDYRREISMVAAEMESGKEGGDEFPDKFILLHHRPKHVFLLNTRIISLCLSLQL